MITGPERITFARYLGLSWRLQTGPAARGWRTSASGHWQAASIAEWEHSNVGGNGGAPGRGAFAAVDVHYLGPAGARAALVTALDARFTELAGTATILVAEAEQYRPGEFYMRELPAILAVCRHAGPFALIVVDGYVDLDPAGRPGLGAHVHAEFGVPVIGVAKTAFRTATHAARIRRGQSARPLFITAAGMTITDAANLIEDMAGPFRIPDALSTADRLARGLELPG
jgi:deoxyribonuclease V